MTNAVGPEIHYNKGGTPAKIRAKDCQLLLEQSNRGEWSLRILQDGIELNVTLYTQRRAAIFASVLPNVGYNGVY